MPRHWYMLGLSYPVFTNSIFGLVTENHGSEGCLIISYSLTIYTDISIYFVSHLKQNLKNFYYAWMILFCNKNNTVKKDLKFPRQNFQVHAYTTHWSLSPLVSFDFSLFSRGRSHFSLKFWASLNPGLNGRQLFGEVNTCCHFCNCHHLVYLCCWHQ